MGNEPPKRPTLTLEPKAAATGKAQDAPERTDKAPLQAPALQPAARPPGPAYTAPRAPAPYLEHFWLVMRDSGRRPKARHETLEAAQEEARRIAAACPGAAVWVIEARTVETVRGEAVASVAGLPRSG